MQNQGVCERILRAARNHDENASIAAVCRRDSDTLVNIDARPAASMELLQRLRAALPLATVYSVENVLDGGVLTQILLPNSLAQRQIATELAHRTVAQQILRSLLRLLIFAFFLSCVFKLVWGV